MKYVLVILLLFIAGCNGAVNDDDQNNQAPTSVADLSNPERLSVYYFYGDGCPICAQQAPFMDNLEQDYDVDVIRLEIYYNRVNQQLFREVADIYETSVGGVPTTFIGERAWVGFSDRAAAQIEAYIAGCLEEGCEEKI